MINIAIADDHEILRDGIKALLNHEHNVKIIAEAIHGKDLIEKIKDTNVDVVLLDINMPVMNGIDTLKYLKEHHPDIKVIALSMLNNQKYVKEMLNSGAKGYLFKNTGKEELLNAINMVAAGKFYICSSISMNLIGDSAEDIADANTFPPVNISKREMEVLKLIAEGLTNAQIADKLFNSKRTIETHRRNLIEKTKAKNTATLIKYAVVNGII